MQLDKKLVKRFVVIGMLLLAIFLLMLLADHPQTVERVYSEGLYPWICRILHPVFNLFPFSVGDVIYIAVIGYVIYATVQIIRLVFKRRWRKVIYLLLGLAISLEAAILIFYVFWGMNYFRPSMNERLQLTDTSYTTQQLAEVAEQMIDSANSSRLRLTTSDTLQNSDTIYSRAIAAIKVLSKDSSNFRTYSPQIKPSLITPLLNYLSTSGYYNPFTSEAQLNYQVPLYERPVTVCHELSHQTGWAAEDEANFAGFLAAIGSKDRLLRYSAWQMAMEECMHALRYRDTAENNRLKKLISPIVRYDILAARRYWLSFHGNLGRMSGAFYDDFLKVNNQPHGLDTYNQMVLLLVAWEKSRGSLEPGMNTQLIITPGS